MVAFLLTEQALKKFYLDFLLLHRRTTKLWVKIFLKLALGAKIPLFDAELNSEPNGVVFMNGTYLLKKFLAKFFFVVVAPSW